jgi:hypothetical protein
MIERKTNKIDSSDVKVNEIMAMVYYVKVKTVVSDSEVHVEDLDNPGCDIMLRGKELIEAAYSSDQFKEEEKVGKTRAAEILVHSVNRPFSVSFVKQDGEEKTMRCRLIKPEPLLGRSMVENLDLPISDKGRLRQVDHRTINWIIVDGVKYTVKP